MDNKSLLKYGTVFILIASIVALMYNKSLELNEPIIMKSYIEKPLCIYPKYKHTNILGRHYELTVIRNVTESNFYRTITTYGLNSRTTETSNNRWDYFGMEQFPNNINSRYKFSIINLNNLFADYDYQEVNIKELVAIDNKDEEHLLDIGDIIFYPSDSIENISILEKVDGSSTDNNYNNEVFTKSIYHVLKAPKDIEIISFESKLLDNFKDNIDIKINGKDYKNISGMKIPANVEFRVESNCKFKSKEISSIQSIDITGLLAYKDIDGNIYNHPIDNIKLLNYTFLHELEAKIRNIRGEKND